MSSSAKLHGGNVMAWEEDIYRNILSASVAETFAGTVYDHVVSDRPEYSINKRAARINHICIFMCPRSSLTACDRVSWLEGVAKFPRSEIRFQKEPHHYQPYIKTKN